MLGTDYSEPNNPLHILAQIVLRQKHPKGCFPVPLGCFFCFTQCSHHIKFAIMKGNEGIEASLATDELMVL